MDIQFQGFNPVFSPVLLLLLTAFVLLFSWWSYSHLLSIPRSRKAVLIILRSSALLLLLLLLFNPFLQFEETEMRLPQIFVYFDNSESMNVERGSYQGQDSYRSLRERILPSRIEPDHFRYFTFDATVEQVESDNLDLDGPVTNFEEVIRHLQDQGGEPAAAVIFSDGIVTRGGDPVYHAHSLDTPLFTIPVGDTSATRDLAIREVITSETGYVDTRQRVDLLLHQEGFDRQTVQVELRGEEELIAEQRVDLDPDSSLYPLSFEIGFQEEGVHHFEVRVPESEGEITTENNRYSFSVNVIDEKTTVFSVAFEIHPDVKMIRSLLEIDQNIEIEPYTWTGERYLETGLQTFDSSGADLILVHGTIPSGLMDEETLSGIPVLQFLSPTTLTSDGSESIIPLDLSHSGDRVDIRLQENEANANHPLTDLHLPGTGGPQTGSQPPLTLLEGEYQLPPTAQVLYNATFGSQESNLPVVVVEETDVRRSVIYASGWFRWFLSPNESTREFTQQFIHNLVSWTRTESGADQLSAGPVKPVYTEGEEVIFTADLTDESGRPETGAMIDLVILDENDQEQIYNMRHQSRGTYRLSAGRFASGDYRFTATARVSARETDHSEGEFTVTPTTIEYMNTRRDDAFLRELAEASGGEFLSGQDSAALVDILEVEGFLDPIEERHSSFRFLHQYVFWFLLVLTLLAAEWILRRNHSLP